MYLKAVYIQGFKSFATKTKIEFNQSITAIVGPNGSGKSNITDAIMWVLGETSAKSLRGNKMEDVIFSGTDRRRPLGFAEVTIVFDNSDQKLDLDYLEVSVTRRMYRSLESEFLINNTKCRLKDIKQLFMDTGIGKDGYSLIGQGKIESILSDKPEERRAVFEEAAGISKYKYKKVQSQNKLLKTEENLIRLSDIISEISKQEENLREQSQKAKKYLEIFENLKKKEINYIYHKTESLQRDLKKLCEEKSSLEQEVEALKNSIQDGSKLEEELEGRILQYSNQIENENQEIYNISAQIQKQNSLIDLYKEKNANIEKEIQRIQGQKISSKDRQTQLLEDQSNIDHQMEGLHTASLELENRKRKKLEEKGQIQYELKNIEIEYLNQHQDYQKNETLLRSLQFKRETLIEVLKEREDRKGRLENNISTLIKNKEEYENSLIYKRKKLDDKRKQLNSFLSLLGQMEEELNRREKQVEEIKIEVQKTIQRQEEKDSRLKLLQNLANNYEGYNKSVKTFMNYCKKRNLFVKSLFGPVGNHVRVDSKYEKAISVALGAAAQNVIVSNEQEVSHMISLLQREKMGRITFLPLSRMKVNPPNLSVHSYKKYGFIGFAQDLIEYEEKFSSVFQNLLGRILVIDNFDNAVSFTKEISNQYRIVTLNGDLFNASGAITGGTVFQGGMDLLTRQTEIEELKNELSSLDCTYKKEKAQCDRLQSEYEQLLLSKSENFEKRQAIQQEIQVLEQNIQGILQSLSINEDHLNRNQEELATLEQTLKEDENHLDEYEKEAFALDSKVQSYLNISEHNDETLRQKREILKELENSIFSYELEIKELEEKKKYLIREKERLKVEQKQIDMNEKEWASSILEGEETLKENEHIISRVQLEYEALNKQKEEKEIALQSKKLQRDQWQEELKNSRKWNDQAKDHLLEKNTLLEKTISYMQRKEDYINGAFLKIQEDYHMERSEMDLLYSPSEKPLKEVEIQKLKKSLNDLGDVNLSSIEEHLLVKERLEFNLSQKNDLLQSREEIKNILKELDQEMKKTFRHSFESIAKYFNEIFQKLFDGGKATIELEGDILEAGIEIKAQPPGKRFQSLSLLSGGERALTAVALLFSLLKVRPAPFCILDEIDAALDDANIKRYAQYLLTLENIQFVIITHRKLTMEIANIMYGVTMEEKGVSKLFSVGLDQ